MVLPHPDLQSGAILATEDVRAVAIGIRTIPENNGAAGSLEAA
jgi:hypothetical protein